MFDEVLTSDNALELEQYTVKITYENANIIANDVNLSEKFGTRYAELWAMYNRVITDSSYIMITPGSYEIREISDTGGNYHFRMQTG